MVFILLIELLAIVCVRVWLARSFVLLIRLLGGTTSAAIWIYSVLSLPGVLVHEIAHFLSAALLGLRTGSIELLPTLLADGGVELGSVQVERKDPIRLAIVGLAPFLFGIPLLLWLSSSVPPMTSGTFEGIMAQSRLWLIFPHWLFLYILTTVVLHMFPSKRDMSAWPLAALLVIVVVYALWFFGLRLPALTALLAPLVTLGMPLLIGLALALFVIISVLLVIRLAIFIILMSRRCTMKSR